MKHTKEYYESFIGKTFKGFKFDSSLRCPFVLNMIDYIGQTAEISHYDTRDNTFRCDFVKDFWHYPADLVIEQILESEKIKFTIEDLANGKVAVMNDGTVEELREVLKLAFPNDKWGGATGTSKLYFKDFDKTWGNGSDTKLPTQSVKEFLKDKTVNVVAKEQESNVFNPEKHYFNEPKTFRSLFELSHILELNEWEFDVLKRLVRCRKKGQFAEDLQKIKNTVDIYKEEYKNT